VQPTKTGLQRVLQLSAPSVAAGDQLVRGKYASGLAGIGTAGPVVRLTGQSTGALVLTCAHVLGPVALVANPDGDAVYSPAAKLFIGIPCNSPFGQVYANSLQPNSPGALPSQVTIGQDSFGVDAALVQVVSNASALNLIPKIGKITGVRDLVQEWNLSASYQSSLTLSPAQQIAVRKYGASTQYTQGTVTGLVRQPVAGVTGAGALLLAVAASSTQPPFSQTYDIDIDRFIADQNSGINSVDQVVAEFKPPMSATRVGSASSNTIKVTGPTFSQHGDSGAPVVDASGNLIGIVASGTFVRLYVTGEQEPVDVNTGNSQVAFIGPALQFVGATFLPAGQQTAGATVVVPGMAIGPAGLARTDWSTWEHTWSSVTDTPLGQRLFAVVQRHFEEVRHLVHDDRRVKVAWHRHKGPAFAAALVRATRDPECSMPSDIDGVPREQMIRAMKDALMVSGSLGLRTAIVAHGDDLTALLNADPREIHHAGVANAKGRSL
jgi:hypothetical protein